MGLEGWLASEGTGEPTPCMVWDVSDSGVRLVILMPADVPLEFELKIPDKGAAAMVRLIRTHGSQYGARFMG
jgi:hypothetical protein